MKHTHTHTHTHIYLSLRLSLLHNIVLLLQNVLRETEERYEILIQVSIIMKVTNKMQLCRLIYYSLSALHVSGDIYAHHQEYLGVFTASGNVHQCRCRLVS